MSFYYFFTSDAKLDEARNPYIQLLSVNDAIAKGIDVDVDFFEEGFDFDKPEVILYMEDEKYFSYPNVYLVEKEDYRDEIQTDKKYFAILEWYYDPEYMDVVLSYINKQLKKTSCLELWKVWVGTSRKVFTPRYIKIDRQDLNQNIIKELYENEHEYICLQIQN